MKTCPACAKENADEARHCGFCGAQLAAEQPKKTMFGMAAVPPAELERLQAEAAARRAGGGSPAPDLPPPASPQPSPSPPAAQPPPSPVSSLGLESDELPVLDLDEGVGLADTLEADRDRMLDAAEGGTGAGESGAVESGFEFIAPTSPMDRPAKGESLSDLPPPSAVPDAYKPKPTVAGGAVPSGNTGSGGSMKMVVIIAVVALLLLGFFIIGASLVYVFVFNAPPEPTIETSVSDAGATELLVTLPEDSDTAVVRFQGKALTVEPGSQARFEVDNTELALGENRLPVRIERGSATDTYESVIFIPAKVRHDLNAWNRGQWRYHLVFEIPTDAELTVLGRQVIAEPMHHTDTTATHRVPIFVGEKDLTRGEGDKRIHKVFYKVEASMAQRPVTTDGQYFVTLTVPRTRLWVTGPPPRLLTADRRLTVSGVSSRKATVTIEGKKAAVGTDGRFRLGIDVPLGDTDIQVDAREPGEKTNAVTLKARRVSRRAFASKVQQLTAEARDYISTKNPVDADALHKGEVTRGKPVKVEGRLSFVVVDGSAAVLIVDTCPSKGCLVGVEAGEDYLPTDVGTTLLAVGESSGSRPFLVPGQKEVQPVPTLRSAVVHPL